MKSKNEMNTIYIGYDPKEHVAYEVLKFSIEIRTSRPVKIIPIKKEAVIKNGMFRRESNKIDGQQFDEIDGKPFSTDFSFTRFLVPHLNLYSGMALFMDCDMYCRTDITELFDMCKDNYYPIWTVHHKYEPKKGIKMNNQIQEPYQRKNWSSLMMFNCNHHYLNNLSIDNINTKSGRWLHGFKWLPDEEADIGQIPEEWNWLDGHSPEDLDAKIVHFTTGGPWFKDWAIRGETEGKYAVKWCNDAKWLQMKGIIDRDKDYVIS
jgi:lipopolysaccharide biosynthesis glycosyltransferase